MDRNLVLYICLFLAPGIFVVVFARKMVESNARAYPRIYTPLMRKFALLLFYTVGIGFIVLGFLDLILAPFLHP